MNWLLRLALCSFLLLLGTLNIAAADDFPVAGILPKEETGASRFLEQHPQKDGRNVVVAIFDTGVDPGAPGLQFTTDGKPKIIDMVDGSGSGDVDTSTVRKINDGSVEGLTERELKIPEDWTIPTDEVHVGIKRAFELFPAELVTRLEEKRREKWDSGQRSLVAQLSQKIADSDAEHPDPENEQKKTRDDLTARLRLLKQMQDDYEDPGPIFDCVVYHDGKTWWAVVDTDEDGQLSDETRLTNYRDRRQFATFGKEDLLNFSVNIYDEGKLLSIVTDCGAHGTHVAGIVAAHFPNQPELNGIAPGAQIVSVKIGDSRLGSNSTGTGEVRGLIAAIANQCDLINMSYGGPTRDPNRGSIIDLYSEIVNKHELIFVVSAGNNGPALSTVGSPGGTTSAVLGIGAYVSPAMMQSEYALRESLTEIPYTWSSRGPTFDGDLGVNLCAPGGAISPVPNWVLALSMLMNGTSMSSPNACGAIALILSGLKTDGIEYSPHSVRRALENTARPLENSDVFAHGRGLIQVDRAFDYLVESSEKRGEQLRFEVDLPDRHDRRGIYLRESDETNRVLEAAVRVRPLFHDDVDNRRKVELEMRISLESTADWVAVPGHLLLTHGGRRVDVRVDPTQLEPGVHVAEIVGHDSNDPDRGPLFRMPVVVVRPAHIPGPTPVWRKTLKFEPGTIDRNFLHVPEGATWADVTVRSSETDASRLLILHAVQELPWQSYHDSEFKEYFRIPPNAEIVHSFGVTGGRTIEICLAQYWSSLGHCQIEMEVDFHGIVPTDPELQVNSAALYGRTDITTPLRRETVAPTAEWKQLRKTLKPVASSLRPLSRDRDELPDERRNYELILEYDFELSEASAVTPHPALVMTDEIWSSWQSLLWQIYDSQKQLLASGVEPESVDLDDGEYHLRFHVRHHDREKIESLKEMALFLDHELEKPIAVSVYADPNEAINQGTKFSRQTLDIGERLACYLVPPKSLPEEASPGDLLLGSVTFGAKQDNQWGSGRRPDGFAISLAVTAIESVENERSESSESEPQEDESTESEDEQLVWKENVRHARLEYLSKLREEKNMPAFERQAAILLRDDPDDQQVLVEQLKILDDDDRKQRLPEIVEAADRVIESIDTRRLAEFFGQKIDTSDKTLAKQLKKMQSQRDLLADALYRKGRAIAYMDLPPKYSLTNARDTSPAEIRKFPKDPAERHELFEENFKQLKKWVDVTDSKYVLLHIRRERRLKRFGIALEALNEHIDDSQPSTLLFKKRGDIYDELGWNQWRDYERKWKLLRFPAAYPPF